MLNFTLKILAVDEKITINFIGYFFAAPCIFDHKWCQLVVIKSYDVITNATLNNLNRSVHYSGSKIFYDKLTETSRFLSEQKAINQYCEQDTKQQNDSSASR